MKSCDFKMNSGEKAEFLLRNLYEACGFSRFKMNKFEEYDLYVRNKDFLISDSVITFTDTSGKLLAMKPDVTLSIIKNFRKEGKTLHKVFYDQLALADSEVYPFQNFLVHVLKMLLKIR